MEALQRVANVARYKAARVERRRSELERESTFLNVMAQVIAAEAAVNDARGSTDQAGAYEVAAAKMPTTMPGAARACCRSDALTPARTWIWRRSPW